MPTRWFKTAGVLFSLLFLGVLAVDVLPVRLVQAQDGFSAQEIQRVTQTASDSAETSTEDVEAKLAELTDTYFTRVEKYRDAERRYGIARETYYQNNTLAAQDEAIRRAQELLVVRSEVLDAYFAYLYQDLNRTLGVELEDKVIMLNQIERTRSQLADDAKDAAKILNRAQVNDTFVALNAQQKDLLATAYETLALIKIGQLQNAIDQATISREMVSTWVEQANITEASRVKKQRGLEEIDHLIQSAKNNLSEVSAKWRQRANNDRYSESTYHSFQTDAEYTYLQLRQAHAFFEEIVRAE